MKWQRYLRNLYRNLKKGGSYQSANKLYHTVKKEGKFNLSLNKIQKWLEGEDSYTLNKEVRRKFVTNYMEIGEIDMIWEADLADLTQYSSWNDGNKYLLGCIDTFSRKLWIQPLKSKHGQSIVKALKMILESSGRQPRTIRSDRGSEFVNSVVQTFLKEKKIGQTLTSNQSQAAYIERCWKSIKKRMVKYMEDKRTSRYIDVVQDLVTGYNKTHHSVIGMAPDAVSLKNDLLVEYNQMLYRKKKEPKPNLLCKEIKSEQKHFTQNNPSTKTTNITNDPVIPTKPKPKKKRFLYSVNTAVRIALRRNKIVSEYDERWSKEIFYINNRKLRGGIDVYQIRDSEGDVLIGWFYRLELQRVQEAKKDKLYDIKKIIKTRVIKDTSGQENKQFLVSFVGFPSKFNQWVSEDAMAVFQNANV